MSIKLFNKFRKAYLWALLCVKNYVKAVYIIQFIMCILLFITFHPLGEKVKPECSLKVLNQDILDGCCDFFNVFLSFLPHLRSVS